MIFFSLLSFYIDAQQMAPQLTSYAPVSPNAASLGKYGLFPVNHNLGTVNAGVPLYTIDTGKQQLDIGLSYNTVGIKVNELASWAGLGWALNCGGAIIRNVKGRPGPLAPYSGSSPSPEITDLENAVFNEANYLYLYRSFIGIWDTQPDEFVINAPGINGSFYFDEDNNGLAVFKDQTRAKVNVISSSEIEIVRADGTLLRFGKGPDGHDATEVSTHPATDYDNAFDYVSAWYLTEMVSPIAHDTIIFRYKGYSSWDYPVATGESIRINPPSPAVQELKGTYPDGTLTDKKYLERIEFNGGYVLFNSVMDRDDLEDEYRLDNIQVYTGDYGSGTLVDGYTFHQSYFNRSGGVYPDGYSGIQGIGVEFNSTRMYNSRKKSLRLDSITIGRNGTGPSYAFGYNTTVLPLRGSTSQDHWGYANTNTGSLMPRTTGSFSSVVTINYDEGDGDREADAQKMKAGVLERITYPTGGYTIFEYEPNQYSAYVNQTDILSKSASATAYGPPTGSNSDCPDQPFYETTFSAATIASGDYVANSGKIYISFSQAQGIDPTKVMFDNVQYNPPAPDSNEIYESSYQTINADLSGTHTIQAYEYRDAYGSTGVYDCAITSISAHWQEYGPTTQVLKTFLLGGLRVKSIENYDGESTDPATIKRFEYGEHNILRPINDRAYKKFTNYALNLVLELSTNLYYDNNLGGRPAVEYGMVTEYDIDPATDAAKGKTVYDYRTVSPQRLMEVTGPVIFKHPQAPAVPGYDVYGIYYIIQNGDEFDYYRTDDWRYGSLVGKEIYKGTGITGDPFVLVREEEHEYEEVSVSTIKKNYVFVNEYDDFNQSQGGILYSDYATWAVPDPNNDDYGHSYLFSYYVGEMELGRKVLKKTIVTDYDMDGVDPRTVVTDYHYDNLDHLQVTRTETRDSKGNEVKARTYYPDDVTGLSTLSGPSLNVQEKEAIDLLKTGTLHRIAVPVQQESTINGKRKVQRTLYDVVGNLVLPVSVGTLKGTYASGTNDMEDRVEYHGYDGYGNPQEVSMSDGPHIYYLWGYSGRYPIAKLENFSEGDITTPIGQYLDAAVAASAQDDDRTIGGSGHEGALRTALSDLRDSLPKGTLMTGYTYDPVVGTTSVVDPKGYTVYYEYDDMNRLMEIRDTDNKLVKDFHYHYITE